MGAPRAFLVDGTAFCYRAFHAIRGLSTADGRPTNAVYGFATMLEALKDKERPEYLAVAFDVGKPTFRHQQFEAYKVQRPPMPVALASQLPLIKALLDASRVPVFEQEGFEAEDVLATIAQAARQHGVDVCLVTGDKDMLQLVNSHITVYNPHHEGLMLDAAAVRARYGVGPEHMVDLLALMGDAVDNIPGVPGIGEKTATALLKAFGSVERLYANLETVSPATRREQLGACRDQVLQSRQLAQIRTDVPLEVELEALRVQEPDWPALRRLFRDLEFKRLLQRVEQRAPAAPAQDMTVRSLDDPSLERALQASAESGAPVGLAAWPLEGATVLLAIATEAGAAWVGRLGSSRAVGSWLEDERAPKVLHDAKQAMRCLRTAGVRLRGLQGDTMIAAYLVNPARTTPALADLADEQLNLRFAVATSGGESVADGGWAAHGQAAAILPRLHAQLAQVLRAQGLEALYCEVELPLIEVLARMEAVGVALDVACLDRLRATMEAKLAQLTEAINDLAGGPFNVNSPRQLAQVLFERLALPVLKRTKTGPSTDSSVLQQLAARHPLPRHLMEYRELSKLVSTYLVALPKLVDPETGRLHTTLNQAATATGRLSSSEPNLQNIPVKTELGRSIRRAFVAGIPDGVLVAADYSQIELRILAHVSGDPQLVEAFRAGRDIHRVTASLLSGIPEAEVQPEQRQAMKAVNFGILYGMSAHGLSQELGLPVEEAQAFITAYFERYTKVRAYLDDQIAQAKRDGYVQTLLGRRRYIPEVRSPDGAVRQFGERIAVNAPIQGTAADLIKRAMVSLARALEAERLASRMVLQVHDELLVECPAAELPRVLPVIRETMEGAITLDVPVTVTLKSGPNWLDLSPVG